jgi:hypothetical protein
MKRVVIRRFSKGKVLRPRGRVVMSINSKILDHEFVDNFRISISLRMKRS